MPLGDTLDEEAMQRDDEIAEQETMMLNADNADNLRPL